MVEVASGSSVAAKRVAGASLPKKLYLKNIPIAINAKIPMTTLPPIIRTVSCDCRAGAVSGADWFSGSTSGDGGGSGGGALRLA